MINIKSLVPQLQKQVELLTEDLIAQAGNVASVGAFLRENHRKLLEAERLSQSYEEWSEDYLEQVAVSWVLACVFVRFLEDNHLIDECWIAGEGDRGKLADGSHEIFFRSHPHETDREYLKFVFREVGKIPAARELFDEDKVTLWAVDPSGDAARRLLLFFKEIDPERGGLKRQFDTREVRTSPLVDVYEKLAPQAQFLGDLYQDLSEHARKKYALLQTPEFVQQFILDRTLDEAVREFGLKGLRLIDPACGSGHFLLGGFDRLFALWLKSDEIRGNPVIAAQNAFDSLFGVDVNPFAIAITRFRMLVAAVRACGISRLHQQSYAWKLNLAVGDSLLRGSRPTFGGGRDRIPTQSEFEFDPAPNLRIEDVDEANRILDQGFHVVVGNPPYITVKDQAQSARYRQVYSTCHRQYSLGVPFTQRFWDLALRKGERVNSNAEAVSPTAGHIGMITANSFMKREFGKKLIEEFFPKSDLTHVIDTSGAYIPGHGTPTVILLGRARQPVGETVRAVLGIKGEPSTPADPSQGLVWRSILANIDQTDGLDEFTSSADVLRETFASHPWSIGGGGAVDLMETINSGSATLLQTHVEGIGRTTAVGEDDCWIIEPSVAMRHGNNLYCLQFGVGDRFRDWQTFELPHVIYPYQSLGGEVLDRLPRSLYVWLWPCRTLLSGRTVFGKSMSENGKHWYEHLEHYVSKLRTPLSIAFAQIATHNHFVLDRGGKVFNSTAPIVKLPAEATEDDHLALLGLLNGSTACFWIKQRFQTKGSSGMGRGIYDERWEFFYQISGTGLENFPVPENQPLALARLLDRLGQEYNASLPDAIVGGGTAEGGCPTSAASVGQPPSAVSRSGPTSAAIGEQPPLVVPTEDRLEEGRSRALRIRGRMIALQEELDWECYRLYGLLDEPLNLMDVGQPPSAVSDSAASAKRAGGGCPTKAKPCSPEYRRKLPHLQAEGRALDVTFRTWQRWELPESVRGRVLQHCLHDHGTKLHMHAVVVMPDHVHLLFTPLTDPEGSPYGLAEIMSGIKGASAHSINKMLGRKGSVWQDESFDHILRSDERIEAKAEYIRQNPVRKGLVSNPDAYEWLWREGIEGKEAGPVDVEAVGVGQPPSAVVSDRITAEGGCSTWMTAEAGCPTVKLGERAFEIVMARQMAMGALQTSWFERHGSTPIVDIPTHWPEAYRTLVEHRIRTIETNKEIGLIERPEYKRRWNDEPWNDQQQRALKGWLLDRLESPRYWPSVDLQTTARLADRASADAEFLQVATLYRGRPDFDVASLVLELVEAESVPFLPVLRYKPVGLRKREVWERTWDLQRQEDAGKDVGDIPVPPKYASADFLRNDYWRLRGKLDVPKERWISYPRLQTESDPSLVVGWAGWDHLQQATALVAYYDARKREGWDARRLAPILAGLDQLLPWIHQWHPEIDPEFGDTAGQSYQALLENDAHELGLTLDDIRNWQPPEKPRKARSPRKSKAPAEADE